MPKSLYVANEHVQPIESESVQPIQNNKESDKCLTEDYAYESSIDEDKYVENASVDPSEDPLEGSADNKELFDKHTTETSLRAHLI